MRSWLKHKKDLFVSGFWDGVKIGPWFVVGMITGAILW